MHFFFFVRLLLNFGSIESGRGLYRYVAEEDSFWGFDPCLFALSSSIGHARMPTPWTRPLLQRKSMESRILILEKNNFFGQSVQKEREFLFFLVEEWFIR